MRPALNLRALSADAALLLLYGSQKGCFDSGTSRVHSVFERVINIESAGRLVTIASRDVDDAPDTIIADIDRFSALGVEAGDIARSTTDAIAVDGRFTVRLDAAKAWEATLPSWPADESTLRSNLDTMRCERARFVEAAGASPLATATASLIASRADALCAALSRGDTAAVRDCGQALLGLGPGLTPSGDDFLVGLFAVLHLPGSPCEGSRGICADIVAGAALRTNAVSLAALTAAARGRVRESIIGLLRALVTEDSEAASVSLRRVLGIGATSGSDIAAGIVAGLGLQLADCRPWKPQPTCHAA